MPNDTSSESSLRDVSNAELFGTGTMPPVEVSTMNLGKSAEGGVIYTVVYRIIVTIDAFGMKGESCRKHVTSKSSVTPSSPSMHP